MNVPSVWMQVLRRLWRDARAGELRLLIVGVALAVAAVSAVALLGDRLERGLKRDAAQLIGGDLVVSADRPASEAWRARVQQLGLQQSHTANFPSMVRSSDAQGGATRLVAIKAVDDAYPLRGLLQLKGGQTGRGPKPGEVWVDQQVLDSLNLHAGDRLGVGDSWLRIGAVIQTEPDRGAGFLAFAPRVMLHQTDLPATNLVQPASRIGYRMAVGAEPRQAAALAALNQELKTSLDAGSWRGARLETLQSGRPELRQTLERGERFLSLVALLAALLSGIAVALSARDFAARHVDEVAMLRVLGQKGARVGFVYAAEFLLAGLIASVLGLLAGWALHSLLLAVLGDLVGVQLPAPGPLPFAVGLGLGLGLLVAFGLPPVLGLSRVPPLRVLRRDAKAGGSVAWLALLLGGAGTVGILLAVARDLTMGLLTLGGFATAGLLLLLLAWAAIRVLPKLVTGPGWMKLAMRQLASRPALAAAQVAALGLGLLALALLALVRTDLMDSWRVATPDRGPNRFVINLLPDQGEPFRAALQQAGIEPMDWHPMFRGRLTAINGQPVTQMKFATGRAERLVEREFNLSHGAAMPSHNVQVAGSWTGDSGGLSVEEGLAQELGLKLGDRLQFDVAGTPAEAPITQLRKVDWSSMRVNFFVIFERAEMPEVPSTWIATFRASGSNTQLDRRLASEFPNATLVDVSEQIGQLQRVLDQVAQAVEILFSFTLAAGLVVLMGAMTATREARLREAAVWRAVGAGSGLLARVQRVELLSLGLLAGLLAGVIAVGLGAVLASQVFQFSWAPKPWVPLATLMGGALLAWGAGWWGLRGVLTRPVVQTLREASAE
ncbi:ABC transporter permease [Inhella sp.]|uniref:ABC transporter permease n=1 Tax=Inhella sp. TaxID=1921806 RepID=UPI0035B1BC18